MRLSLFSNKAISYEAKSAAYRSLILPILLYGAETWCLPNQFTLNSLHSITLAFEQCAGLTVHMFSHSGLVPMIFSKDSP